MKRSDYDFFGVITTICAPSPAVRILNERLSQAGGLLIAAGDRKGPSGWTLSGSVFLSLDDQLASGFDLAKRLPEGHYARKNIGYLEAMRRGAACIYETDDDNAPLPEWTPRNVIVPDARQASGLSPRWVNVYRYFTDDPHIWPRGFPLDWIHRPWTADHRPQTLMGSAGLNHEDTKARSDDDLGNVRIDNSLRSVVCGLQSVFSPIQQGLVNGSPDVDAIWRLTQDRPFTFDNRPPVWLGPGQWCPFNTQSTWWWPEAYPLLYIPSNCSFRMCDIWRSFVAQRCLWAMGAGVVFHAPEVVQERNPHDLMKDFHDEIPGYTLNSAIGRRLQELDLRPAAEEVSGNLRRCYEALVEDGVMPAAELALVDAWIGDMGQLGALGQPSNGIS